MSKFSLRTLYPYTPPEWASKLANPPTHRLKIAQLPTPIYKWNLPGVREGYEVSIKRDDLTGAALSGNKIRKLEFLLAVALDNKCDNIITMGGLQSNHSRATAVVSRQLGLQPHLMLRAKDMDAPIGCRGNLMLDRLVGTQIVLCPYRSSDSKALSDGTVVTGLNQLMELYAQRLRSKGCNPYVIPVGGSNTVGVWGYIEAFKEFIDQGVLDNYDDIVVATGSGGTVAGLGIANYLTGSRLKIHGVTVCDNAEYFHSEINGYLRQLGLADGSATTTPPIKSEDIIDMIDGYKGDGYALSTEEERKQLVEISSKTGVLLDRVYTLKAVRGLLGTLTQDPSRFKGKRILFVHTGGIHSLFDGVLDETVLTHPETNKICKYTDVIDINP